MRDIASNATRSDRTIAADVVATSGAARQLSARDDVIWRPA